MATSLTLSMLEIILLLFGAIILGITIHFFITSRKSLKASAEEMGQNALAKDEWKLKYLNDMELRDGEIITLKQQLQEAEENVNIYSIEAEELRQQNSKFEEIIDKLERKVEMMEEELDKASTPPPPPPPPQPLPPTIVPVEQPSVSKADYLDQLLIAQSRLMDQNQKINQLLGNLDIIREKEEKQRQVLRDNAELSAQINRMKGEMSEKEKEIDNMKQKEQLTKEMSNALDIAYTEFNTLQSKIQKLESQLTASKLTSIEYEDLKEEHSQIIREVEDYKAKSSTLANENLQLQAQLKEMQDKLKESNFQKQQLQKRAVYLEELNADLQIVADANKKLESQMKRIGELENMLNTVTNERSEMMRRQGEDE